MLSGGTIEGGFRVGRCLRVRVVDVRSWIDRERLPRDDRIYRLRKLSRLSSRGKN